MGGCFSLDGDVRGGVCAAGRAERRGRLFLPDARPPRPLHAHRAVIFSIEVAEFRCLFKVVYTNIKGKLEEIGRTEVILNSLEPSWITKVTMSYQFEIVPPLIFRIYDVDTKYHNTPVKMLNLAQQDFLGEACCNLSEIVTKFNHSLTLNLGVIVDMDFMEQSQYMLRKDPFLRISKVVETAGPIPICKTEVVPDNLNPVWRPITLTSQQYGSKDNPLLVECFDFNSSGDHGLPDESGGPETADPGVLMGAAGAAVSSTLSLPLSPRPRPTGNCSPQLLSAASPQNVLITRHEEKAAAVLEFYDNLIGTDYGRERTINLDSLGCPSFELFNLDLPFSEEEVFNSIKDLPPDKAPGPDGFTGRFYKCCWAVIKNDIMAAIQSLWSDRLDEMVSPNQSAFVKKRFVLDNFMMVQQTVKFLHSQNLPRILLKLDITKAFDSVSWAFLLEETVQHTFLDYISSGFELNFMVAVDFTALNGDTRVPQSLHYIDPSGRPNSYQQAILGVGEVLQFYDTDRRFPAWGFGARAQGHVSHCFNLNTATDDCECFPCWTTMFGPVINKAAEIASQSLQYSNNKYFVLIITDGVLTDIQETKDCIVRTSDLPLSILIVGVGNADFKQMEILDTDNGKRLESSTGRIVTRDIVQFVPMKEVQGGEISVVQSLLEELPGQFLQYMRTRGIKPQQQQAPGLASAPVYPPQQ
ncbi:unnamed protein product [Miscanthus lutarioriparius]|uniref:C2 domain-containing protein n=1 Tax=Miscanthus lutarioriparius TaxID=422564 RepID=A0A811RVN9_9POAL|nr:unnamed protein product [Miscanthus lutarioriparius]